MESTHTADAKTDSQERLDVDWDRLERAFEAIGKARHHRPPGSFTVAEYATREGIDKSWARRKLQMLVEKGTLESTSAVVGRTTYFYFPEDKE